MSTQTPIRTLIALAVGAFLLGAKSDAGVARSSGEVADGGLATGRSVDPGGYQPGAFVAPVEHHADRIMFRTLDAALVDAGYVEDLKHDRKNGEPTNREVTLYQSTLCLLGFLEAPYPSVNDTRMAKALLEYTAWAGLPSSTHLDNRTRTALTVEGSVLFIHQTDNINLLGGLRLRATDRYVHAEGVWEGIGEQVGNPLNAASEDATGTYARASGKKRL